MESDEKRANSEQLGHPLKSVPDIVYHTAGQKSCLKIQILKKDCRDSNLDYKKEGRKSF